MLSDWLFAFDFDHTVVDDNTDTYVTKLLPNGKVPKEIKKLNETDGWTAYMGEIFKFMCTKQIKPQQILKCVAKIPFTSGMTELLTELHQRDAKVIIISDSNSVFIDHILTEAKLAHTVHRVYTNPAHFDDNQCLQIKMYHYQDTCPLSTKNLCKGFILEAYINEMSVDGTKFKHVAYIGDGGNDLCPALRLKDKDFVFPRQDYTLLSKLQSKEYSASVKATVHPWKNGTQILNEVLEYKSVDV